LVQPTLEGVYSVALRSRAVTEVVTGCRERSQPTEGPFPRFSWERAPTHTTASSQVIQGWWPSPQTWQTAPQLMPAASGQRLGATALLDITMADVLCDW